MYLSKKTMATVQRNWIANWFEMKFGELNWIVNWIEMKYWCLNWIVNWVVMQWASWRIEFELNPKTLSEFELSCESKKSCIVTSLVLHSWKDKTKSYRLPIFTKNSITRDFNRDWSCEQATFILRDLRDDYITEQLYFYSKNSPI